MVYADTDFFVALMKQDDWLKSSAEKLLSKYEGEIETSLTTFIELCLILGRYDVDVERALAETLEIAETDFDENLVFQAIEHIEEDGMNTFDAFHAAHAASSIISSDSDFDQTDIDRISIENR